MLTLSHLLGRPPVRKRGDPYAYSTVQYSTVQYSTVQYSTVQYSTVQYSTVQYSLLDPASCFALTVRVLLQRKHWRRSRHENRSGLTHYWRTT
jgi:hypothetical protein